MWDHHDHKQLPCGDGLHNPFMVFFGMVHLFLDLEYVWCWTSTATWSAVFALHKTCMAQYQPVGNCCFSFCKTVHLLAGNARRIWSQLHDWGNQARYGMTLFSIFQVCSGMIWHVSLLYILNDIKLRFIQYGLNDIKSLLIICSVSYSEWHQIASHRKNGRPTQWWFIVQKSISGPIVHLTPSIQVDGE